MEVDGCVENERKGGQGGKNLENSTDFGKSGKATSASGSKAVIRKRGTEKIVVKGKIAGTMKLLLHFVTRVKASIPNWQGESS